MSQFQLISLRKYLLWFSIVISALLLFSIWHDAELEQQNHNQTSKLILNNAERTLTKRLEKAEAVFNRLVDQIYLGDFLSESAQAKQYFSSAMILHADGSVTGVFGKDVSRPILNESANAHLSSGATTVSLGVNSSSVRMTWLKRTGAGDDVLLAELPLGLLMDGVKPEAPESNIYLVTEDRKSLNTTQAIPDKLLSDIITQRIRYTANTFGWQQDDRQYQVNYKTVEMQDKYATSDWILAVRQLQKSWVGQVTILHKFTAVLIILALTSYFWLSKRVTHTVQHEKPEDINGQLHLSLDTAQPVSDDAQRHYIQAMSEIDRAILSNANFDVIIDLLLNYAAQTVPSVFVALTRLDKNLHQEPLTLIRYPDGTIEHHPAKFEKAMRKLFDLHTNGFWVNNPETISFMKVLVGKGADQLLAQPVYREGEISAILYFGLSISALPNDFQIQCAQNFADRLGVAKTAAIQERELYQKEYFDTITNLFNRTACRDRLSQEMSRARRQQSKLATFYINIDGFKKVNDSLGYVVGDSVLREVAERLKSSLREADVIARFGGDEFVVIVSDVEKVGHANKVAEKIYSAFTKPFSTVRSEVYLTASIGISIYPDDGITVDELIHHADSAMMSAKRDGNTHYAFYEENMSSREIWQAEMERELRLALARNELFMVYQPQVCGRTGKLLGVEALMRWKHPERGVISPMEFIHVAEESGLIIQLGRYGRKAVCQQFNLWREQGVKVPNIALNVSGQEIQRKEFIQEVTSLLGETGVPASVLEMEITESILIEDTGNVNNNLKALHELGVRIAIDDFGTGYSNLSYLVRLPFDVLKLDKSFVQGVGKYSGSTQVVTMIIDMAHHLGKTVVAEGVENEMQREFLVESGCESIQGYLLSKPLTADQLSSFINGEVEEELLTA